MTFSVAVIVVQDALVNECTIVVAGDLFLRRSEGGLIVSAGNYCLANPFVDIGTVVVDRFFIDILIGLCFCYDVLLDRTFFVEGTFFVNNFFVNNFFNGRFILSSNAFFNQRPIEGGRVFNSGM